MPACRGAVSLIKRVMILLSSTRTQVPPGTFLKTVQSADLNVSLQSIHISSCSLPPVHHLKVYLNKTPKGSFANSKDATGSGRIADRYISTYSACCSLCHASFPSTTWARHHTDEGNCRCYAYTGSGETDIL